jgi:hypothetical protein
VKKPPSPAAPHPKEQNLPTEQTLTQKLTEKIIDVEKSPN